LARGQSQRQAQRLLGRGISPSQGRFLHRTTQPQNKSRIHGHPCHVWDSNPRSYCTLTTIFVAGFLTRCLQWLFKHGSIFWNCCHVATANITIAGLSPRLRSFQIWQCRFRARDTIIVPPRMVPLGLCSVTSPRSNSYTS
jgi:hypothetical protein